MFMVVFCSLSLFNSLSACPLRDVLLMAACFSFCAISVSLSFRFFFFSSRRRHTRCLSDWSSDVCSSDLLGNFTTDYGVVLDLSLGKEWWVGNSWGLGFNGGFNYHSIPDKQIDANWTRSEERRVGKECRCRGVGEQIRKTKKESTHGGRRK